MKESIEIVAELVAKCGLALAVASTGAGLFVGLVYFTTKAVEQVVSDWKWRSRK